MKVGILRTETVHTALLEKAAGKYPDIQLLYCADDCIFELVKAAGGVVTERCHELMAQYFNILIEAGCDRLALMCSLIKPGIEQVRRQVPLPIIVYDDALAEKAVAVTPDGGRIAVVAMKQVPLEPGRQAVLEAAERAGKRVAVDALCVESARRCLEETGDADQADACFERYLREHQGEYDAFAIPQVPLARLMPRLYDMKTPVFDSYAPLFDKLVNGYADGFEAGLVKK